MDLKFYDRYRKANEVVSEKGANHNKVEDWIAKVCEVIRTEFTKKWEDLDGVSWENGEENGSKLKKIVKQTKVNIRHFQGEMMASGNIDEFDLHLLVASIQSVILMSPKGSEEEKNIEINHLKTLIPLRNSISHSPNYKISKKTLSIMWHTFVPVFKFYGISDVELKMLERSEQNENINLDNTKKARKLIQEAQIALKNGEPKTAINKCFEGLLMAGLSAKDQSSLYCTRSSAYLQLSTKEFGKALRDAKQAIKILPNCGKIYVQLAEVNEEQGELKKSLKNLEKALAFNPVDKAITDARNTIRFKLAVNKNLENHRTYLLRNFREAEEEFTKTKGQNTTKTIKEYQKQLLKGNDPFSWVVQGHQFRDEADGNSNYAKAAECYQKASEKSNPEALLNLAMLTLHGKGVKKNVEETIRLLLKASSQAPIRKATCPIYGVGQAGYLIGLYYQEGTREFIKALKAYGSSYENGCGLAAYRAGAILYHGRDHPQDINASLGLWKAVARNEVFRNQPSNALAYAHLVKHYITVDDFKEAHIWNNDAIKDGITNILSEDEDEAREMLQDVANVQMYMKFASLGLDDGCMPLGLGPAATAQIVESYRIQLASMKRELLEKYFSDKEELGYKFGPTITKLPGGGSEKMYPVEKTKRLKKMAKRGNVVAQRLLDTQNHVLTAQGILLANDDYDDESIAKIVSELARAICLEHYHIKLEEKAKKRLESMLEAEMKNISAETFSEFDRDLRICWAIKVVNDGFNYETVISFLKQSVKNYPNEEFFYIFIPSIFALKHDFETAAREVNIGLEIFPNSSDLLFQKATSQLNLQYLSTDTKITDYVQFLEHAPKGGRNLPQANYAVSILYDRKYRAEIQQGRDGNEARQQSMEYFQKGKEAEKSTAPDLPEINLKLQAEQIFSNRAFERFGQQNDQ